MPRKPDNGKTPKTKVNTRIDLELKSWGIKNGVNFSRMLEQKLTEEKEKMTEEAASGKYILVSSDSGSNSRNYDALNSHKRRYKRALGEAIQALNLELDSLEKDFADFEPSKGIPEILLELTKINQRLIGMQEKD